MALPSDKKARKDLPMARGLLDYFPDALAEVAGVSMVGNEQHNPGEPLHWAMEKSIDEADCIIRHLADRGTRDDDGTRHSAKVAWRALALLQREIVAERLGRDARTMTEEDWKEYVDSQSHESSPGSWVFGTTATRMREEARRHQDREAADVFRNKIACPNCGEDLWE